MRRTYLLAIVFAALALAGCGKDRVLVGGPRPPSPYPLLLNPYSVMDALRIAYGARDTVEIKILFDDLYEGSSIDQRDPMPVAVLFSKADEVAHVSALRKSILVGSVSMTTAPNMLRYDDAADPPGWATIRNPIAMLEVGDVRATLRVDIRNETMEFKFIPKADLTSPTDTTWKIIRWSEIRN